MSYIFISHASNDKLVHVKPIVEALVYLGEPVWIDRPGIENNGFGFDPEFIAKNDIDYVGSGNDWSTDVQTALRNSGAVLGCLSKSLKDDRKVLIGELTVARAMDKLVTCIVDDLAHDDLQTLNIGLLSLRRTHSSHLNSAHLQQALDDISINDDSDKNLVGESLVAWQTLQNIIGNINRVRREPRRLKQSDILKLVARLKDVKDAPAVKVQDIPEDLIHALGDHAADSKKAHALIQQGNKIISNYLSEENLSHLLKSYTLRSGELPPAASRDGDGYWQLVLGRAGARSRKTLYSFLSTPVSHWAFQQASVEGIANEFKKFLRGA